MQNNFDLYFIFKVKKKTLIDRSLSEVISKDFRNAKVLEEFGLKFCCNAELTIKQACKEKGIDYNELIHEIEKNENSVETLWPNTRFNEWNLDFLIDYIIVNHHEYVRQTSHIIFQQINRLANLHSKEFPEMLQITNIFEKMHHELEQHTIKEEKILFPYIKRMVKCNQIGKPIEKTIFRTIKNPIRQMLKEHEDSDHYMEQIRELSNNFNTKTSTNFSHINAYKLLKEFYIDLHQHCHLENNVLFPKAILLEKQLKKNYNTVNI